MAEHQSRKGVYAGQHLRVLLLQMIKHQMVPEPELSPAVLPGYRLSTMYHVRSYATNSAGTAYGPELTFTTSSISYTRLITTVEVSSISLTSAVSGGNITYRWRSRYNCERCLLGSNFKSDNCKLQDIRWHRNSQFHQQHYRINSWYHLSCAGLRNQ